ncbi:MAG: BTAD domain-containing putative transcriptional regulator [Kineosporiaceae bacterium]
MVTFGVLGPLAIWRGRQAVELTGARQRSVLARLLVARGRVVPVEVLVDDLWPDELPGQPTAAIQAFVSRLRRQLEPGRQPRSSASVLVTSPPGYALVPDRDGVDAWEFEQLVHEAAAATATPATALESLDRALALWRGTAYQEFADLGWARGEVLRLHELRLMAVENRADACLQLGMAAEVVTSLAPHVVDHPLRERAWALLAAGQYAAGRQSEALATLRRARTALAGAVGLDPGPALRALEADILAQIEHLVAVPPPRLEVRPPPSPDWFVGRQDELERLVSCADRGGVVHLTGEAGAGKTALVSRLADVLADRGWLVGVGRCVGTGGVLPGWPWAQAVRRLADLHPPRQPVADSLGWLLRDDSQPDPDPVVGQHRIRRALQDYLVQVSTERRLLLVLDDVHEADGETLAILVSICRALAGRPALVTLTRRGSETSGPLEDALARLARHEPERLTLEGLGRGAVAAIMSSTVGGAVDQSLVDAVTERTGGNPFFVRELARLSADAGPGSALTAVPDGVQEVLRRRITPLPSVARTVLTCAAVLGRDITLDLLMDLSGETEDEVLDHVEAALLVGLLVESRPGVVEFPHALVRDAVYAMTSRLRRARLHIRAAVAIERQRPDDVTAVAYHYERGGDPAVAGATLHFARLAARQAERRYAYREALRWWQTALHAFDQVGGPASERLQLLVAQVQVTAYAGDLVSARSLRMATLAQADTVDDPVLAAAAIASFDVPTIWTNHPYGSVDQDLVRRTEAVLRRLPPGDSEARCRMLINLALELEGEDDERGSAAARDAEAMARRIEDPQLMTMALNAVVFQNYAPAGHRERIRVGGELLRLGEREGLVAAQVLGQMALAQTDSALGDFESADRRIAAVEDLADTYEQPLTSAIAAWYHGLRRVVAADLPGALAAYRKAEEQVSRLRMMPGQEVGESITITTACAWLGVGRLGELAATWDTGPAPTALYQELYALALAHAGRVAEARQAAGTSTPIRQDYTFDLHWGVRGLLAVAIDDPDRAAAAYRELLPYANLLAAAGSAVLVVAPVAEILGDVAAYRGNSDAAAEHYQHAVGVAQRAGARHWVERITRAGSRLDS